MSNLPDLYINHEKLADEPGPGGAEATYSTNDADDRLDWRFILGIFARQQKLFVLIFVLIFGIALLLSIFLPPKYIATAEIALNTRNQTAGLELLDMTGEVRTGDSDVATELRVLYSRSLAAAVYTELNLAEDPQYNSLLQDSNSIVDSLLSFISSGVSYVGSSIGVGVLENVADSEAVKQSEALVRSRDIDNFLRGLSVRRMGNSYALAVSYVHSDPEQAAKIANEYALAYTVDQLNYKRLTNLRATEFMEKRIAELGEQSQEASRQAQLFRIEHDLISESGSAMVEKHIASLNQDLAEARADLAQAVARYKTASTMISKGARGDDFTEALTSEVIKNLRAQQAEITGRLAELSVQLGSKHPTILQTKQELRDVNQQIQNEIDRHVANLRNEVQGLEERVNSLLESVESAKKSLTDKNRAMVEFQELDRQSETSKLLYENYLNTYKETLAREGIEQPDARILSTALVPSKPSSPNVSLNLGFGLALAFAAASATAFIAEMNFRGMTLGREVESKLHVPNLGIVPSYTNGKVRKKTMLRSMKGKKASVVGESVSNVLTSIQFVSGSNTQVIYVTSAFPDEGKSTLSALMALVASRKGAKTIVVDCDRFKAGVTKILDRGGQPGLADFLCGSERLENLIQHGVFNKNCSFIAAGSAKPSKEEVGEANSFQSLIQTLRRQYDLIVLDGPPLLPISEAREIGAVADYTVVAAKWRSTPSDAVAEAIKKLPQQAKTNVGVVLTQVDLKMMKRIGMGDSYQYYAQHINNYLH